jgi:hypothetical protein
MTLTPEQAREYRDRDWGLFERLESPPLTPSAAFAMCDGLLAHMRICRPDWPDAEERAEDFAAHVRLAELFNRARKNTAR